MRRRNDRVMWYLIVDKTWKEIFILGKKPEGKGPKEGGDDQWMWWEGLKCKYGWLLMFQNIFLYFLWFCSSNIGYIFTLNSFLYIPQKSAGETPTKNYHYPFEGGNNTNSRSDLFTGYSCIGIITTSHLVIQSITKSYWFYFQNKKLSFFTSSSTLP